MTGLLILVLTLSMTGCSTWKQIKQVVQDVLTAVSYTHLTLPTKRIV